MRRPEFERVIWNYFEDELLKAAVKTYGQNQWHRISTLFYKKTALQCRARWYEYLDPSIKEVKPSIKEIKPSIKERKPSIKTGKTPEEDQTFLDFSKLMLSEWTRIGYYCGISPVLSSQRYYSLLCQAYLRRNDPTFDLSNLKPVVNDQVENKVNEIRTFDPRRKNSEPIVIEPNPERKSVCRRIHRWRHLDEVSDVLCRGVSGMTLAERKARAKRAIGPLQSALKLLHNSGKNHIQKPRKEHNKFGYRSLV